jgi:hypothetical protein
METVAEPKYPPDLTGRGRGADTAQLSSDYSKVGHH